MSADVLCLRPEADFREVGVQPPADLRIRFAAGPDAVPDEDLATARAVVLASVGPALDRAWADRATRVELVQFTGAGVDRAAAAFTGRPGVVVANVPAANAREVAEYVLLATGNLLRGLALADREIRAGRYREVRGRLTPAGVRSLHSATVGVVGLGQIGLAVARLFRAAGAQVGYSDPAPRDPAAAAELGLGRLDLGGLLAGSDVVTLHVPLMAATRGLIGEAELRQMRPGAILVNASRGGVVDEAALAAALEEGHLGGAVVDVYTQEPPPPQSPLLTLSAGAADRVLYTPHVAGVAYEAARRLYTEAWANVQRVLVGGLPRGQPDPLSLNCSLSAAVRRIVSGQTTFDVSGWAGGHLHGRARRGRWAGTFQRSRSASRTVAGTGKRCVSALMRSPGCCAIPGSRPPPGRWVSKSRSTWSTIRGRRRCAARTCWTRSGTRPGPRSSAGSTSRSTCRPGRCAGTPWTRWRRSCWPA